MECRIIHVGRHDSEDNGITFQATHALPKKVAYDSTYTGNSSNIIDYTGNWSSSTLRKYLNTSFKASLPSSLQRMLASVNKLSNKKSGENPVAGKEAVATTDKLWIISYTELIRNAATKVDETWEEGSDSHDGSTYSYWEQKDFVVNNSLIPKDNEQAKILLALNSDRAGTPIITDILGSKGSYSWLRSLFAFYSTRVMVFTSYGYMQTTYGYYPFRDFCVSPVFSL